MKNNILFFAQQIHAPWIEGVKNNSIQICELLNKQIETHIISHKGPHNSLSCDTIRGVRVSYFLRLHSNKFLQVFYFLVDAWKSLFFVIRKKPNKIFVQYLDPSYFLSLILIKIFRPNQGVILTLYSLDEVSIGYKKIFIRFFPFEKIVIISEYLRESVESLGVTYNSIVYIPLSYDKKRYLQENNINTRDNKKILFSAGIVPESGSFFMVDLAKIMPEYNFIFTLREFNQKSENEFKQLKKYIEKSKVKNIDILRNIDNMEQVLSEVGALILPLQDIRVKMLIPVALLEAMARSTLCFVSDLPNLELLIQDKTNAIIFRKNSLRDLQEKIVKYIGKEDISQSAYEFAKEFPSFEEISKKYYSLII